MGEFGLIHHLTDKISLKNSSTIKGVGDDAAILDYGTKQQVVTTDLLVEGIHFNLMYVPLKHLGYKSVMVNLSDVFAMNATPKQVTVSLAISSKFSVEAIDELYEGIYLACEKYGVDLIGGDTTSSLTGLLISVTALGEIEPGKAVMRSGAQVNDLICVSGDLGGAYMGLQLLERENEVFKVNPKEQPQFDGYDYILERQLKPEARGDIVQALKTLGVTPTSMIDISDGLSSELMHICTQSKVGCLVYEEKIPLDYQTKRFADELSINPLVAALNGGEDYELLFTVPIADHDKIKNDPDITIIGHITEAGTGTQLVTGLGSTIELQAQGWNPLKEEQ
ncbi:thiamine-phosphate kinase [Mangrovibacterium diazotrophicum]|uniref:Thiamine-monophosphate kinase n=2 Tax=Mangrovibacterium diazotrophicum TaxID=1261403 RepID=A0A419W8I3_9BACT|nr:thiamine-phosphate kinase [Mangrovibacterium diazotrophicum]